MDEETKTVYVLLTHTGTLFTNAPYNHVSIVFDEKLNEIYSFGRKFPRNPLIAGFIREDVYFGTYRYFYNTRCQLLKINVLSKEYFCIRNAIQNFVNNKDLYSYNLIGLMGVAIRQPSNQKNKYFCSQFVAEVFEKSGLNLWSLPPALVTPNDFFMHLRFELVYEERLYDYPLLNEEPLSNISMNQFHNRGVTYEFNHSKGISKKTVKTQIVPLQHDNVQQETNVITARIITTFRGDRPWQ